MAILALNLTAFTTAALMCHRRLADDRPSPARLTEFYFFIALGGVVGGIFNALVAPLVFTLVFEYPVAMAACLLLRPWRAAGPVPIGHEVGLPRLRERLSGMALGRRGQAVTIAAVGLALLTVWGTTAGLTRAGSAPIYVETTRAILALALCGVLAVMVRRPMVSAMPFIAVVCVAQYLTKRSFGDEHLAFHRSFFGVHHVYAVYAKRKDGAIDRTQPLVHKLQHGTTLHGAQLFGIMQRQRPDGSIFSVDASKFSTTYYHPKGPVGDIMRHLTSTPERARVVDLATAGVVDLSRAGLLSDLETPGFPASALAPLAAWPAVAQAVGDTRRADSPVSSVAVIGLGSGGLASWARPGDRYTFYEIDPAVRDIATNTGYFTYITDARARGARVEIRIGDGRIEIAKAPDASYGLIVVDAFSSDSIPVHLLTREALDLYLHKLRDDGVVAFHISNRYFDLRPVLAHHRFTLAQTTDRDQPSWPGLNACLSNIPDFEVDGSPRGVTPSRADAEYMTGSTWVVFGKSPRALANFTADPPWWKPLEQALKPQELRDSPDWTDGFSDVLSVFRGWRN
jgi:hypothetical protein